MRMPCVSEKVAIVSHGARGLGAAQARLLVEEGAMVVVCDVLDDEGTALAAELGPTARFVHLDVTKLEQWEAAIRTTVGDFGALDILVNNASIVDSGTSEEYTVDTWNTIVAVNLTGVFLGIKAAVPEITKSTAGSIINVSSAAGLHGCEAIPAYAAARLGVRGLTKAVALDLAKHNVRVNSVRPGPIRKPKPKNRGTVRQLADPVEVANLVLFLSSDESNFSTGVEFVTDGGESAGRSSYTSAATIRAGLPG